LSSDMKGGLVGKSGHVAEEIGDCRVEPKGDEGADRKLELGWLESLGSPDKWLRAQTQRAQRGGGAKSSGGMQSRRPITAVWMFG
jgi:hypothetical protein